jgi:hypothetical protein
MPRYWFRQKKFGYGATPNTWQGWLFTIAVVLGIAALAFGADFVRDNTERLVMIAVGMPVVLVAFVLVTHAKTDGGWRWRWGSKN